MDNKRISTLAGTAIILIFVITAGTYVYQFGKSDWHDLKRDLGNPTPTNDARSKANLVVGNDRDEHGCILSAGYSWCEEKQKCLRSWEESCGLASLSQDGCLFLDGIITSSDNTSKWRTIKSKYKLSLKIPSDWTELSAHDGSALKTDFYSIDNDAFLGKENEASSLSVTDYTFENSRIDSRTNWIIWYKNLMFSHSQNIECTHLKCGEVDCVRISSLNDENRHDEYIISFENSEGIKVLRLQGEESNTILASIKRTE